MNLINKDLSKRWIQQQPIENYEAHWNSQQEPKKHERLLFLALVMLGVFLLSYSFTSSADQDIINPKSWRPDGEKEVWNVWKDGTASKCNPHWDGNGVKPCGVSYYFYFDTHPEWYPEVFIPTEFINVIPISQYYVGPIPDTRQNLPEPSTTLLIGSGMITLACIKRKPRFFGKRLVIVPKFKTKLQPVPSNTEKHRAIKPAA